MSPSAASLTVVEHNGTAMVPIPSTEQATSLPAAQPKTNGVHRQTNGLGHHPTTAPDASWYADVRSMLATQPTWSESDERALLGPYDYLDSNPGHGVRSQLIDTFDWWLQVPREKLVRIDHIVRMAHTSSLMIDDIEDGSVLRRGRPSAHMVFGTPLTINSANYIYFLFFEQALAMSDLPVAGHTPLASTEQVQKMMVEEMLNLHRGQGIDLYWRDNFICPTEKEYIAMVNNKTGGLFRIVLKLMTGQSTTLTTADQGDALIPLVNLIGLEYQIRDDYMNLRSGDYTQNKGYCEDLSEGKFSFPLIHALAASQTRSANGHAVNGHSSNGHAAAASSMPGKRQEDLDEDECHTYDSVHTTLSAASAQLMHHADALARGRLDRDEAAAAIEAREADRRVETVSAIYDSPLEPATPSEPVVVARDHAVPVDAKVRITSHAGLVKALRQRPRDAARKRAIVEYMDHETDSFRYTCQVLLHVDRQVRHELRKVEHLLDHGRPNEKLRAYVNLLRSGWHGSPDCPPVPASGKDTPYEEM